MPASTSITRVTSHISRSTDSRSRRVASHGAHCSFWHAVVSSPASTIHAPVTSDLIFQTGGWFGWPASVGTDISLWQTGVSHPTPIAVHAIVTSDISGGTD